MHEVHSWSETSRGYAVLVHGGAGSRAPETIEGSVDGCRLAAEAAGALLEQGASALDAVQRAVEILEDDPRFNAGTGAALTETGELELDASLMDGRDLRAGAVCCLPAFRHPVAVARALLDDGRHLLMAGSGAAAFARAHGAAPGDPAAMITPAARARLERLLARGGGSELDTGGNTVGAVARDRRGHLAAATSTGGILGKRPGRVGDTPLIGAGTYADDAAGASSATGLGECIIRVGLCITVVTRMGQGSSARDACIAGLEVLHAKTAGDAGLIALAPGGSLAVARNTQSMPWAACWEGGSAHGS